MATMTAGYYASPTTRIAQAERFIDCVINLFSGDAVSTGVPDVEYGVCSCVQVKSMPDAGDRAWLQQGGVQSSAS